MLVGKSKIQLFDAKTGEEQLCVENKNIVTKAIEYLLNPPANALAAGLSYNTILKNFLPICTNGLGGLLLWDKNITASADNVYPPIDNNCVGFAGSEYSGTDSMRGTYNTAESGYITGSDGKNTGYRHVWDFASDKANGTINCLTLTSKKCGDVGYGVHNTSQSLCDNFGTILNPGGSYGRCLSMLENGIYVYFTKTTSNITLNYVKRLDTANVTMFDEPDNNKCELIDSYNIPFNSSGYSNYTIHSYGSDTDIVFAKASSSDKINVLYVTIDCNSHSIKNQGSAELSGVNIYSENSSFRLYCLKAADGYYASFNTNSSNHAVAKFSADGQFEKFIFNNILTNSVSLFYPAFLGDVMVFPEGLVDNGSGLICNLYSTASVFLTGVHNKLYFFSNGNTNISYYQSFNLFMGYLGTINNLDEPIIKTASQTMKITYELSHATG